MPALIYAIEHVTADVALPATELATHVIEIDRGVRSRDSLTTDQLDAFLAVRDLQDAVNVEEYALETYLTTRRLGAGNLASALWATRFYGCAGGMQRGGS